MSTTDNTKNVSTADSTLDVQTSESVTKKSTRIEAYGSKGIKNVMWRRTFASVEQLQAWCEKHDVTVIGMRNVE